MVARPVVYVPGFPASHLKRAATGDFVFFDLSAILFDRKKILAALMGPDDLSDRSVVAAHPIRSGATLLGIDLAKQAESLYEILGSIGYDTVHPNALFEALGWDWRKPVDDDLVMSSLRSAILRLEHDSGRKPMALVHSTGGLVLRALLEREPELTDHLEGAVAFGVPWGGTLRTIPLLIGREGFGPIPADETQQVMARAWAAFDLLPSKTANERLGLCRNANGEPISLVTERNWFPDDLRGVMNLRADRTEGLQASWGNEFDLGGRSLPITNVAGFGAPTLLRAQLEADGNVGPLVPEKEDRGLDDGDGTVPRRAVAWLEGPEVRTFDLPIGHSPGHFLASFHNSLWKNPGGQDLLWTLLADETPRPFVHLALDGDDVNGFAETLRVRGTALGETGAPLEGVKVRFSGLTGGAKAKKLAEVDGRFLFSMRRSSIRETSDGHFRRLSVKVSWDGGEIEERSYLLPR